ncbi:hypothetical protein UJ101_01152 [Flavobacteriaceae bacterium UJ101]|nr:hypothetical protein UJ101_01152 [Flavobacteriaceae bacterium UJ101]
MKKVLFSILGFLLVIFILLGCFFVFGSYSSGYRAGTVMKMTEKGFIFKTNEGQMNTGGFVDEGTGETSIIWNFSVKDDQVIKDIETAVDKGKKVKLYYEEKYFKIFFLGDTKYFVNRVEEIGQ